MAFKRVSFGVNDLFWKINRFLEIHKFQQIEADSVPRPTPMGGRDGIRRRSSSPLLVVKEGPGSKDDARGGASEEQMSNGFGFTASWASG